MADNNTTAQAQSYEVDLSKAFKKASDLTDDAGFPPRSPMICRVSSVKASQTDFKDEKTGQVRPTLQLVWELEPLDQAVETLDGLVRAYWKVSTRKNSIYALQITALDQTMQEILGDPEYQVDLGAMKDQMPGQIMIWGEVDKTDPMFDVLGPVKKEMRRHPMFPMGAPRTGWERDVPADLNVKKLAAIKVAEGRKASKEAGNSQLGTTVQAQAPATIVNLKGLDDEIATWLSGKERKHKSILDALNADQAFSQKLKTAGIWGGVVGGAVVSQLLDAGTLVVEDGYLFKSLK